MRVLWLCNVMIPMIAEQLNMEASNKEGWISGLADMVLTKRYENGIDLAVVFPANEQLFPDGHDVVKRVITVKGNKLTCYGFLEDTVHPERYDEALEGRLKKVLDSWQPDIVHCFGTEYPHTLAMCKVYPKKNRILIGIQGLCTICAKAYLADMPDKVIQSATLRDKLRKDSILEQQEKFELRGEMEQEALQLVKNITGRTEFDRYYAREWNPDANYYNMNETLRSEFYGERWSLENCKRHSIFVSQADYPLKGLHYLLEAMPRILEKYPDTKIYVAGNSIVKDATIKQRLKISGYGKYLRKLIQKNHLRGKVVFLGKLDSERMKQQYLKSHLFVCCSTMENSPNSLGEAMLLGMPCVSADVGGIPSIFTDREDGILYEGYRNSGISFNNTRNSKTEDNMRLDKVSNNLLNAILNIWKDEEKMLEYCDNARKHAEKNHKGSRNYAKMTEIYTKMFMQEE